MKKKDYSIIPLVLCSGLAFFFIGKLLFTLLYVFAGGFPESGESFAAANRAGNAGINVGQGQTTLALSADSTVIVTYVLQPSVLAMASPAGVRLYALDASGNSVASALVYREAKTWGKELSDSRSRPSKPETLVWKVRLKLPEGTSVKTAALQGGLIVASRSNGAEFTEGAETIDERYAVTMLSQEEYAARLAGMNDRIERKDRALMFESFVLTPLMALPIAVVYSIDAAAVKKKRKRPPKAAVAACYCVSGAVCALAVASLFLRGPLYLDGGAFLGKVVEVIFGWFQPVITH